MKNDVVLNPIPSRGGCACLQNGYALAKEHKKDDGNDDDGVHDSVALVLEVIFCDGFIQSLEEKMIDDVDEKLRSFLGGEDFLAFCLKFVNHSVIGLSVDFVLAGFLLFFESEQLPIVIFP